MSLNQLTLIPVDEIYFGDAFREKDDIQKIEIQITDDLFMCSKGRTHVASDRRKEFSCLSGGHPSVYGTQFTSAEVTLFGNLSETAAAYNADLLLSTLVVDGNISVGKSAIIYQAILNEKHSTQERKEQSNVWAEAASVYLVGAYGVPASKKKKFSAMLKQLLFHDLLSAKNNTTIIYVNKVEEFLDTKIRQAALYAGYSKMALEQLKKVPSFDFMITQTKISIKRKGEKEATVLEERDVLCPEYSKSASHDGSRTKIIVK